MIELEIEDIASLVRGHGIFSFLRSDQDNLTYNKLCIKTNLEEECNTVPYGELKLATFATLETLAERLAIGAALRTRGIAEYLRHEYVRVGERFSLNEFFGRARQKFSVEFSDAVDPAHVVIKVLSEAIINGDIYI